jgi:hypothetical protein
MSRKARNASAEPVVETVETEEVTSEVTPFVPESTLAEMALGAEAVKQRAAELAAAQEAESETEEE